MTAFCWNAYRTGRRIVPRRARGKFSRKFRANLTKRVTVLHDDVITEVGDTCQGDVPPPGVAFFWGQGDQGCRTSRHRLPVTGSSFLQIRISKFVRIRCGLWKRSWQCSLVLTAPSVGSPSRIAHSVLVESPTGSGKTIMGLEVARQMQRRYGFSIGWVAMRRNLLSQAEEENRRRGFGVDLKFISMFDKNPPQVDMLVVDEAQHDAAMSMANLHCTIHPKKILGLTATPFRTDRIKLCFDKVIKDAGIHQLIQDGYLSRYHHYTIPAYTPESGGRVSSFAMRGNGARRSSSFTARCNCEACHGC